MWWGFQSIYVAGNFLWVTFSNFTVKNKNKNNNKTKQDKATRKNKNKNKIENKNKTKQNTTQNKTKLYTENPPNIEEENWFKECGVCYFQWFLDSNLIK